MSAASERDGTSYNKSFNNWQHSELLLFFLFLFQNWGRSLRYFLLIGTSALSLAHDNAKLIETRRTFLPNTGERLNRQVKARQCTT